MDRDRQQEQSRGERREPVFAVELERPPHHDCNDERERAGAGCEPRRVLGTAVHQPEAEVTGPQHLEDEARGERERQHEDSEQAAEDGDAPDEGKRERDEARRAPRLRKRHRVREVLEDERHEHRREHGERAAENERSPAPAPGKCGERQQDQRGNGHGAVAREHLGRQVVARPVHDELVVVMAERALQLRGRRRVRDGVAGERQQREADGHGRDRNRREPGRDSPGAPALGQRGRHEPAAERQAEEGRVRRVDEREREGGHRGGEQDPPRRRAHVGEDQGECGRHEQLARGGRGPSEERIRPAVPGGEADERHLRRGGGRTERRRAEEGIARLERHEDGKRKQQRALVLDDERRIDAGQLRDRGEERVPERKGVPGVQPAVDELVEPPGAERAELDELPHAREVERAVAGQRPRRDVPEQQPENDAGERHQPSAPRTLDLRARGSAGRVLRARSRAARGARARRTSGRGRRPRAPPRARRAPTRGSPKPSAGRARARSAIPAAGR